MKKDDVPQDDSSTYAGHKKVIYATDSNNRYEAVESSGWEAEELVTCMAVDELKKLTADARKRVNSSETSPLEFHMYNSRLDVLGLAQVSGRFQWQIRRHFKPQIFNNLSDKKLASYCEAMGLSIEQIKQLPDA